MTVVSLPKILRDKLTDVGADALVQIIDKVEERSQKVVLEMAEERFEKRVAQVESKLESKISESKADLEVKMAQVESKLEAKIAQVETTLETKITESKSELRVEIARSKSDIVRWMFIFWIGQSASTVGILTAILSAFFTR